jgi:adhesin/invasin
VAGGNAQTATVANAVAAAPSVNVTDQFTNPVSGVAVAFAVTGGGGSLTGAAQVTNGSGIAQVGSWTLGNAAGANALSATPTGVSAVGFTATGTADVPAALVVSAGDLQSAVAGSPVPVQPAVRVNDQYGNAVAGATVTFTVTGGGGSVTGATPASGGGGIATLGSWTLGGTAGPNTLSATVSGVTPLGFTATGLVGPAAAMSLSAGNAQTDTVAATLATAYAVLVVDANNNPVSGTTVTWASSGGGTITASSVTNASGIATATRVLGTVPGPQTATGSVGGLTGSPVGFSATASAGAPFTIARVGPANQTATVNTAVATDPQVIVRDRFANPVGSALATGAGITGNPVGFTATATAGAPASLAVSTGNGQTAVTSNMVANPPTAVVVDAFNNPVSGVSVTFSPSGSGSVGTPAATTNASGLAVTTWTVVTAGNPMQTNGTHTNTLTASSTGLTSAVFSGFARYTFPSHINPLVTFSCTGCHDNVGVAGGLTFGGTSAQNYAAVFNVLSNCAPAIRRVSPAGGVSGADVSSMMMRLVDPGLTNATCSPTHPAFGVGAPQLDTLRAWMRNGAPNN